MSIREISAAAITDAVEALCIEANTKLPTDVKAALDQAEAAEPWPLARETLGLLQQNLVVAADKELPICQDTGMACVFIELGQDAHITGGLLRDAVNEGVSKGYTEGFLRKSVVRDPIRRVNTDDNTPAGQQLRLLQEYFFVCAGLQSMLRTFRATHLPWDKLPERVAIHTNDTHPAMSIPELIRLLMNEGLDFDAAFELTRRVFAYTNHTVMGEALEKWDLELLRSVVPEVCEIIERIDARLKQEHPHSNLFIVKDGQAHMANLSVYMSTAVNGVAEIHSQILKDDLFKDWYAVYPERFQNKTNGITPRRWLGLSNPELCGLIDSRIGTGYLKNLDKLAELKNSIDEMTVKQFNAIKLEKKRQLCRVIEEHEGVALDPSFLFDVQVKRLHEYKRQLLNALCIMDLYLSIKDGTLTDFTPTAFIFGAKAAPGYRRAKAIIHYVNRIAELINNDPAMEGVMKVVFVQNYNCSYAEHIIPAADISEQISPAGTEASGTGNMKLMLNGAVTLGTLDGANVEIAEQAGRENEYIFGATVEEINMVKPNYNARSFYEADPALRRAVDTLIDGTVPTDEEQHELYTSLLKGASWHKPDQYFLFYDFDSYKKARLQANRDYRDRLSFGRKCLENVASAGKFSSDRTIRQYADEIWHIKPVK